MPAEAGRMMPPPSRKLVLAFALAGATISAMGAPGAMAATEPATRLVSCGQETCLLISGHRADETQEITVNGHRVAAEGGKAWRVRLALQTVRDWSLPLARTVDVAFSDPRTGARTTTQTDLPIGLLGHATDLAVLEVRSP